MNFFRVFNQRGFRAGNLLCEEEKMSIQFKTYSVYIDGSTLTDDIISIVSKPKGVVDYEKAVESVLDTLIKRTNGIGQILLNCLPADKQIIISPYTDLHASISGNCNAIGGDASFLERGDGRVYFTPSIWQSGGFCFNAKANGATDDEILLHELLHAYQGVRGTMDKTKLFKPKKMYDTVAELFAILITNIYMSENGKTKLRRDHNGFGELPAEWSTSEGFLKDQDFFYWVEKFWFTEPQLVGMIAASPVKFNPFRAYKDWLMGKVGALKNKQYGLNLSPQF